MTVYRNPIVEAFFFSGRRSGLKRAGPQRAFDPVVEYMRSLMDEEPDEPEPIAVEPAVAEKNDENEASADELPLEKEKDE
jgi:hypothetical protein